MTSSAEHTVVTVVPVVSACPSRVACCCAAPGCVFVGSDDGSLLVYADAAAPGEAPRFEACRAGGREE